MTAMITLGIKNIPDNKVSRQLLYDLGFKQFDGDVQSMDKSNGLAC
jgi:hypothetical protein